MASQTSCVLLVIAVLAAAASTQVDAAPQRQAAAQRQQQQPSPDTAAALATLPSELPKSDFPPGYATLNLTQLAPMLPLVAAINATVMTSWMPIIERTPPSTYAGVADSFNSISPSTFEGLLAGLPYLNWTTVNDLLPIINTIPPATLKGYLMLAGAVDPRVVEALLPTVLTLDPVWVNKVVPAMVQAFDAEWLAGVLKVVGPRLSVINADQIVALLPALRTVSVETWQKMIELLNDISPAGLELLVHLLDITGPYLDKIVQILNAMRRMLPIDKGTVEGKTTLFTKPPGTSGFGPLSFILARKPTPPQQPNNGAPPAPVPAPVMVPRFPKTLGAPAPPPSLSGTGRRL